MFVLGVKVDNFSLAEARQRALGFFDSLSAKKIFTVNPEMVVRAQKDEYFKQVLNAGDLNTCDGFGVRLFFGLPRVTGVDFMVELCALAAAQGRGVFLLGSGIDEVVKKTADNLQKQFPNLKISGCDKGPLIREFSISNFKFLNNIQYQISNIEAGLNIDQEENSRLIARINASQAEIIFVAFGMGKQEKWIHENLVKMPGVKIAMGVGGAFDFISGTVPRAPLFFRRIGLEWMYRLARQPQRFWRIINATAVFSFLVIRNFFNSKV